MKILFKENLVRYNCIRQLERYGILVTEYSLYIIEMHEYQCNKRAEMCKFAL